MSNQERAFDAIVIGAGHNGLAAATVLARNGQRVLVLEKNNYVGGMGGTREILKGCQNEVGASVMFPLSSEVKHYFDFEGHGVEMIPLPVMAVNLSGEDGRPLVFYKNPLKLAFNLLLGFGPGAMLGFVRLLKFCEYPAQVLDRFTARKAPRNLEDLIAEAPTEAKREQLELAFKGSAMDIIDRFFPDQVKHRELRANMAFAAVQATYKGPYTPGSGLCLIYTMAQEGSEGMMQRVKGGMGKLSESLASQIESMGGEIRLKQRVSRIVLDGDRVTGVELKSGEQLMANVVISNLDKPATFAGLLPDYPLGQEVQQRVDDFEHRGAFVHMLFKLKGLPHFAPRLEKLNRTKECRFGGAMVLDPEVMQACYESCLRGELPEQVPLAYQFPTVMDPSLAPEGYHIGSAYGFYFPCDAPKGQRGKLRDRMGELIIDHISMHMPDFRELLVDTAIFSSDHFASMQGVTNGDWTHGLLHPEQMIGDRCLIEGTGHVTPVKNLFLCGASCHPGPGVTFLPGYNCAHEVLALAQAVGESGDGVSAAKPAPAERAA
ncbi:NAD(P)/FAD-dependent oxidoreductase [Halieaceae bacterium IMCC14734]|uniref:Pyridine nucleotide-disulfide oxidoreductase domain-containing protein 2 n=1 Tax=Candidatus Litorirhabdus singularis TaxID=2518993 RepID=A0ABT3TG80_9GAMM|nr:NAD(P)/FAD-dependent oxidoreductase [Candidatus Litorirhabdus singularis]MCX2980825.1 NAD(P)/FAD-dependent oxidoreductase [Candidatus Litorirhabdus singularis]